MYLQTGLVTEALPTQRAWVRLLPGVGPHMGRQVARLCEPFPTFCAGVDFISRVNPHVHVDP